METDGLDSTWAPEDLAWVISLQLRNHQWLPSTLCTESAPSLWREEAPGPHGISLPLPSLLHSSEPLASLEVHNAGESALDLALPFTGCATWSKCLTLSEPSFLSCGMGAVLPASWSCCEG